MRLFKPALRQAVYTNKVFWRNPLSAFFTFAFPLMFLVIFTLLFGHGTVSVGARKVATSTFYVPAISAFSVITACFTNLAIGLTISRDFGVLKRIRGTPMPPAAYMAGRIAHAVFVALILVAICTAFGAVFYGAEVPARTLPAFVLTLAVGAASFCALGIAATAMVPNAEAAPAVVNGVILPLLFISNVFVPLQSPPAWLDTLSKVFPIRHFAESMLAAFFPAPGASGLSGYDLGVVAAWGAAGLILAVRKFSWEPRL